MVELLEFRKEFLGEDNDELEVCKANKKQIRLTRWNKENYLSVEYKGEEECEFIKKDADTFEILTILKEKPITNKFTYHLEGHKEFNFWYQPELTEEEKKTCTRPENVIGSYAVYHKTKKNHILGKINYKCGKAFHIFRPKIIDKNDDWIWGEMNIIDDKLTITISQEFLDNAVYPVIVDPTFGYDTHGTSGVYPFIYIAGSKYASGGSGTLESITAYVTSNGPPWVAITGTKFRYAIYEDELTVF